MASEIEHQVHLSPSHPQVAEDAGHDLWILEQLPAAYRDPQAHALAVHRGNVPNCLLAGAGRGDPEDRNQWKSALSHVAMETLDRMDSVPEHGVAESAQVDERVP
jgi:hypothetical protein